jgi:hypothetical protein
VLLLLLFLPLLSLLIFFLSCHPGSHAVNSSFTADTNSATSATAALYLIKRTCIGIGCDLHPMVFLGRVSGSSPLQSRRCNGFFLFLVLGLPGHLGGMMAGILPPSLFFLLSRLPFSFLCRLAFCAWAICDYGHTKTHARAHDVPCGMLSSRW